MHDYFLAHSSKDKSRGVRDLHEALTAAGVDVFLDEVDILPGDDWDLEIPKHHRDSKATLVMVSTTYDRAYYLRDEVHTALRWARDPVTGHRVVPIFLDGFPDPMPYGLTIKNGLDLQTLGLPAVVKALVKLARTLTQGAPPSGSPPSQPCDRQRMYEALCDMQSCSSYFDEILAWDLPSAKAQIPNGPTATPADRALALVQWATLHGPSMHQQLCDAIRAKLPGRPL